MQISLAIALLVVVTVPAARGATWQSFNIFGGIKTWEYIPWGKDVDLGGKSNCSLTLINTTHGTAARIAGHVDDTHTHDDIERGGDPGHWYTVGDGPEFPDKRVPGWAMQWTTLTPTVWNLFYFDGIELIVPEIDDRVYQLLLIAPSLRTMTQGPPTAAWWMESWQASFDSSMLRTPTGGCPDGHNATCQRIWLPWERFGFMIYWHEAPNQQPTYRLAGSAGGATDGQNDWNTYYPKLIVVMRFGILVQSREGKQNGDFGLTVREINGYFTPDKTKYHIWRDKALPPYAPAHEETVKEGF